MTVSRELVEQGQIPTLVTSADIGLVFYSSDKLNTYHTSHASGKMARYMQCGIPVITIDFPGFRAITKRYDCGVVVSGPEQLCTAVSDLDRNYGKYREAAYHCYAQEYELTKPFQQVLDFVATLD